MTREGPTGVGSVPGSPTSIGVMYRGRGMTSLDPDIDGGLPWFRGVVPAAGTRPGTRQEPAPEPGRNNPWNQPRHHPWNQPRNLQYMSTRKGSGHTTSNVPDLFNALATRLPSKKVMSQTAGMHSFFIPCEVWPPGPSRSADRTTFAARRILKGRNAAR